MSMDIQKRFLEDTSSLLTPEPTGQSLCSAVGIGGLKRPVSSWVSMRPTMVQWFGFKSDGTRRTP